MSPEDMAGADARRRQSVEGDRSLLLSVRYEDFLRCLWLLRLRGTDDSFSVITGDDARIRKTDGAIVFRQVKKREGKLWGTSDLKAFLAMAWGQFTEIPKVRFEFFTNESIAIDLRGKRRGPDGFGLNPANPTVRQLAGTSTQSFCESVTLHQNCLQPKPQLLTDHLEGQVKRQILSNFTSKDAEHMFSPGEVSELAAKLVYFELGLQPGSEYAWQDVERAVGLDAFVRQVETRARDEGRLSQLDDYVAGRRQFVDDENARACRAALDGKNIARDELDEQIAQALRSWLGGPATGDFRVLVLQGAPGSGKTWTLFRLGVALSRRSDIQVLITAERPVGRNLPFRQIGAAEKKHGAVILVDELFPDWADHILTLQPPLGSPLLFIGTAEPWHSEYLAMLKRKRASRVEVIPVRECPVEAEIRAMAVARGVRPASREIERGIETNFRHASHLLSGVEPSEHLGQLRRLTNDPKLLSFLGLIWLFASEGVPVPRRALEDYTGLAIPEELRAWTITLASGEVSFEDPREAGDLFREYYGGAHERKRREFYDGCLSHVDPEEPAERAFARKLLRGLAVRDLQYTGELMGRCADTLKRVLALEPQWALVFSWVPTFAKTGSHELLEAAVERLVCEPPTTMGIQLLWLEAYDAVEAREVLRRHLSTLTDLNTDEAVALVRAIGSLRDEALRREGAHKLTSWFVDIPESVALALLARPNVLQQVASLAGEYGDSADRTGVLVSLGKFILRSLDENAQPQQNWLEAYLTLAERVLQQSRFGLALEILRRAILGGDQTFPVSAYYRECLDSQRQVRLSGLVALGARLLDEASHVQPKPVPAWAGKLVQLVAAWGDDQEWQKTAEVALRFLESIDPTQVAFDRVAALVVALFGPMRRGPRLVSERFLRDVIAWVPGSSASATHETGKFILHLMSFVGAQPWISDATRSSAKRAFLGLVDTGTAAEPAMGEFFEALSRELGTPVPSGHPRFGLPLRWAEVAPLIETYLSNVWKLCIDDAERGTLARRLIETWGGMSQVSQNLVYALLRLGDIGNAVGRAKDLVGKPDLTRPDPYGLLAIGYAHKDILPEARKQLYKLLEFRDSKGHGLRPHVAHWMHLELAERVSGRERELHLICAELCRDRTLRPLEEVLEAKLSPNSS